MLEINPKPSSHWLWVSSLSCIGIYVLTWCCKGTENHVTLFCFPPPSWRLQHLCNRPWNGLREDFMYSFIRFYPKHTHKSIKSILIQQDRVLDIQNKTQWSCVMEVLHMTQTDRTWPDCLSLDLSDPLWEHSDPFRVSSLVCKQHTGYVYSSIHTAASSGNHHESPLKCTWLHATSNMCEYRWLPQRKPFLLEYIYSSWPSPLVPDYCNCWL